MDTSNWDSLKILAGLGAVTTGLGAVTVAGGAIGKAIDEEEGSQVGAGIALGAGLTALAVGAFLAWK